jgi:AraC-like DNA-binding protein
MKIDSGPKRFSTDDVAEPDRLARWREEFGRALVQVDIEPFDPDIPFRAEAILQTLPGARTGLWDGTAARYDRTPAQAAGGDDSIGLVVNLGPTAVVSQRDDSLRLATGDAFPMRTEQPGKLITSRHLGILLPRSVLASRVEDIDRALTRVIPGTSDALRMLVRYITLVQDDAALGAPDLRQTVANHIHDLAALALGANRETRESGLGAVAAARLAAVLADINKSFTDPGLTLAAVARRQGVSPRYLQRLFEESGVSFTVRVNELRLQRAFALLSREHNRSRPISEIAWQSGFANVSHFNRLFRARFGDTPSGIRTGQIGL